MIPHAVADTEPHQLLVVDDDLTFRLSTAELLRQDGHRVVAAGSASDAMAILDERRFDLILIDLRMPGLDGLGFTEALRKRGEGAPILMISGFGTVDAAVQAMQLGADDFLTKPVEPDVLTARVASLLERRPRAGAAAGAPAGLVGRSAAMREVFAAIAAVAPTDTTVLITGETGTGKELVARATHDASPRRGRPFVAVNSAALAPGLVESELFGHVRGAFTGAVRDKQGIFEAAAGGTVFLDEIGDVTPAVQYRLLRVLQEREVTPVGTVRPVSVNVRVIAATSRDLRAEVAAGRFRDDLFYRLNVFRIALPPLRDRRTDIPLLVEHALERLSNRVQRAERLVCSPLTMRLLQAYAWPGNVRELFSVLESAALRAGKGRVDAQHLPPEVRSIATEGHEELMARYRVAGADEDERTRILAALDAAHGVRARAAEILGMGRTTLWRKLRQLGLDATGDARELGDGPPDTHDPGGGRGTLRPAS
jgi:DNA-binding NtrC family response regulator